MKITSLFYEISSVLGREERKSFQPLDEGTVLDKEYVITQRKNDGNITPEETEEIDINNIIQCMQSINEHRFQNLSSVIDFRSWFASSNPNDIPFETSKRLFVETSYLSDNEIEFGNYLSKAKFDKIYLYHITSLHFQLLVVQDLVEWHDGANSVIDSENEQNIFRPKIYDLFSQDFSHNCRKKDNISISGDYVEWKHDCEALPNLLKKGSDYSMVTMNMNMHKHHWAFYVGIDFHNNKDDKKVMNDDIQIYYFDSLNKKPLGIKRKATDNHQMYRCSAICRLLKLVLLFGRSERSKSEDIIISSKQCLKIKKDLYDKMNQMEDEIVDVSVTQQRDYYTCGLHIIRFFS